MIQCPDYRTLPLITVTRYSLDPIVGQRRIIFLHTYFPPTPRTTPEIRILRMHTYNDEGEGGHIHPSRVSCSQFHFISPLQLPRKST